jgi:Beta-propeller repeat
LTDEGDRREVKGSYVLKGNQVSFKVKSFDTRKRLIIDPVLSYSTLLAASYAYGIAVDPSGNAYVTGLASSFFFPTTPGAFQTTAFSSSAFVSKLDSTGSNLIYSTYLSGDHGSTGTAIAVDASGIAYVTGYTSSSDFPLVNPLKTKASFFKTTGATTTRASSLTFLPWLLLLLHRQRSTPALSADPF